MPSNRLLPELLTEFVAATSNVDRLIRVVAQRLATEVGDSASIHLIGADGVNFDHHVFYSPDPELAEAGQRVTDEVPFKVGQSRTGRVAATGVSLLIPEISPVEMTTQMDPKYRPLLERLNIHSFVCVPLLIDGKPVGTLSMVRNGPGRSFGEADLKLATDCAAQAALALAIARSREAERAARKSAEDAVAALRESEAGYRRIVETTAQGIVVTDAKGITSFANKRMAEMLGFTVEEMIGRPAVSFLFEEDLTGEKRAAAERRSRVGTELDARLKRKDGTALWIKSTRAPIRNDAGEQVGLVSMVTDATDLRRSEDQLRQAQKMDAVGRLAGGIAHDFNNLLTLILSYGELLAGDASIDSHVREEVGEIVQAAQRAADLTRQLLMFSRQQVVNPRLIDLNDMAVKLDSMLRRVVGEDIDLVTLPDPKLGKVIADQSSIEQVLMNLVVNARDAMPKGGRITIETANVELDEAYARGHVGTAPGPHVALMVSDTGEGMDAALIPRIFEPFFTTKAPGKGTGLGLSTVFGIVQQWGGSVWVYSEVGRGTTFKVYLPLASREVITPAAAVETPAAGGSETVLLVEDQAQVREVAKGILELRGYTLLSASTVAEALKICADRAVKIDLVLTDVVLPQQSGTELIRQLLPMRPGIKVLYMSGYTDDSIVRHGVLENEVAFLQKPFTPDSLARRVRDVLDAPEERR
jgi:PAS domain S-box-containing protein